MITIRIDVDYPTPSRTRSFFYTALNIKPAEYLRNAKIIVKMINKSLLEVKAYWFFTPKTIPDRELLNMLNEDRHEVALHIVNDPCKELQRLENATNRKTRYYTIHGTERLLARILWRRWKSKTPEIPDGFPLQSFHQFPTIGLDSLCYSYSVDEALRIAQERIKEGDVMYFHPIWLFQRGRINHRGPFYEVLRRILQLEQ